MGSFPFVTELAEGQSTQLATPEGRWFTATGKSIASIAATGQNDFVYQPGGVAHDNVYSSWPALVAAVNAVFGQRRILVDPTFAGDLGPQVPAGTWALNNVALIGKPLSAGFLPSLTFLDGAHVTSNWLQVQSLVIESSSTTPVMTFAGGVGGDFTFFDSVFASPNAPFFRVATDAGSVNFLMYGLAALGDGTNPVIEVNGAATAFVQLFDPQCVLFASATSGTGAIDLSFVPSTDGSGGANIADANIQFPQIAGLVGFNTLPNVAFTPNLLFLANLLAPSTVEGVGGVQTSDATTTDVPGTNLGDATVPMPDHTGGMLEVRVIARIPSTDQTVSWHAEASFKRRGATLTVGTLTNVGGNALASFAPSAGDAAALAGTTISITVGANGINANVTGLVATTIDWNVKATYFYTHS